MAIEHNGIEYEEELNGVPIKSFDQILREILSDWKAKAPELDILPGSDAHIRASAIAGQLYASYVSGAIGVNQYLPDTATGQYLRVLVKEEGIVEKPATKARGHRLQFRRDPNLTRVDVEVVIPAGSARVVTRNGVTFETTADAILPPEILTVEVPYQAIVPGKNGNIQAGDIIGFYGQPPAGINYVTNLDATADGSDAEDDETIRARYFEATEQEEWHGSPAWVEAEAKKIPGITSATAIKNARGEGTMDVLVTSGDGIPSQEKLDEVLAYLSDPTREPINVDFRVIAPEPVMVNLRVQAPGITQAQAETAYKAYIASVGGGGTVYPSRIAAALINAGAQFADVQEPAAPITLKSTEMPLPGVVTLV
ncbi:baseplate J/gp47 family protein [Brevibacillus borstelensis]|uniref:baseplate J/gp47 family protein n=1 Tax=Brevibacillus borstelensis TaxID=45462 RepID=UPI000469242B|nr:baseplate J/gp47 family protein [Brevibacillus borstelensis]NOU54914.1 baseplate J/gp47 family protein [Brevibacillus borstelensis]